MSLRKLKHHEQRLLKKVDFLRWNNDDSMHVNQMVRRYHLKDQEEYVKYNKIVGHIRSLVHKLKDLDPADPFRQRMSDLLLKRLFNMGLINSQNSLLLADQLTAGAFCRRRLPIVLVKLKMCQHIEQAVTLIEHGHIRVGPTCVKDPAFLVSRQFEDFVTWVDGSKIKRTLLQFHNKLDDYDNPPK